VGGRVAALHIHVLPTGRRLVDQFAADAAHRFTASHSRTPRTQVPQHFPGGVVDGFGVREHPRPATAHAAATHVVLSRRHPFGGADQRPPVDAVEQLGDAFVDVPP